MSVAYPTASRACERRPQRDAAHWHVSRVTKRRLCLTGRGPASCSSALVSAASCG